MRFITAKDRRFTSHLRAQHFLLTDSSVLSMHGNKGLAELRSDMDHVARMRFRGVLWLRVPLGLLWEQARLTGSAACSLLALHLLNAIDPAAVKNSRHYRKLLDYCYAVNEKYTPEQEAAAAKSAARRMAG